MKRLGQRVTENECFQYGFNRKNSRYMTEYKLQEEIKGDRFSRKVKKVRTEKSKKKEMRRQRQKYVKL